MGFRDFLKSRTGFRVDNSKTTSAANLTLRQSLYRLALVTILSFLWVTLHITRTRSSGLQAAYFGAYPLASLGDANWILRHYGYKTVFIFGLCLYGIGAFCMWSACLNRSFGGFCASTFVIDSGLGSLETAANPYLTEEIVFSFSADICGPPKYAEIQINFAQAFNGIGTVVAPALASYVFFSLTEDDASSLKHVQWVYLAIGIFVFILAAVFFVSSIPQVIDEDMAFQVSATHVDEQGRPFWKQYKLFHATLAQFTYTGSQVAIAGYFITYVTETWPAMLFLTLFFESVCFPTIVAPPILGHVADMHNNTGFAFIVPTMSMVLAWTYAVAVNFVFAYRNTVDKVGDSEIGVHGESSCDMLTDIEASVEEKDEVEVVHIQ